MKNLVAILTVALLLGCQNAESAPPVSGVEQQSVSTTNSQQAASAPAGATTYSFAVPGESTEAEVAVTAQGEITLGSWQTRRSGGEVQVTQGGEPVLTIKQKETGKWVAQDPQGNRVAKVKVRDDGGYKVVDANEKMLTKLKKRPDGYKVVDSDEESVLIKVKVYEDKIKVKDGQGATLSQLRGQGNALLVSWLSIEKLPIPLRLGMATMTWSGR